jgi:threonyl-tRNA synthetase
MSNLQTLRHSASHVLAIAVKELYPEAKLGIGPAIDDGFYYDFDNLKISEEDLKKIEKRMAEIVKKNLKFEKIEKTPAEAKKILKDEPYKLDLLSEIKKPIFYKTGNFTELCAGPHVGSTGEIKTFKLLKTAGAYWRGDSKNKMLTRIYGTAFESKKELENYLTLLEEAEKRNHLKIGRELDLFSMHEEGPGFPFFHNKGMIILNELINFWREKHRQRNYLEVRTPTLLSRTLWETSGHWAFYGENMYTTKIDGKDFGVKPMNCSGGLLIYKSSLHSYKELPLRVGELGNVHRHELSGVLNGLFRVRAFTQDDAHIFCTSEQLENEIIDIVKMIREMFSVFGFKDYGFTLSVRGEKKKEKYMGTDKEWEWAQNTIFNALKKLKINPQIMEGEAKFYGPSLDVQIKDALGREWQCSTIQLDFNLPKRFEITYEGADGKKHTPYMLHRVIYGSLERFLGILIEHYAGKFPLWLSPVQAVVMPITEKHLGHASKIHQRLLKEGIRAELDERSETISKKVRDAQVKKIPYMITIGDKETEKNTLAVRDYSGKVKFGVDAEKFIKCALKDIKERKNTLSFSEL